MASSARRNKILAMATEGKINNISEHTSSVSCTTGVTVSSQREMNSIKTDINDIWQRPYSFSDFKAVFDYRNEYENSFEWAQATEASDIEKLKSSIAFHINDEAEANLSRDFLICNEQIEMTPLNDEQDIDIFCDSDNDKDITYIPESSDSDEDLIDSYKERKKPSKLQDETKQENNSSHPHAASDTNFSNTPEPEASGSNIVHLEDNTTITVHATHSFTGTNDKGLTKDKKGHDRTYIPESLDSYEDIINSYKEQQSTKLQDETEQANNLSHGDALQDTNFSNIPEPEASGSNIVLFEDNTTGTFHTIHASTGTNDKGLTKDGKPRIRKKNDESVQERLIKKKKIQEEKNSLKEPCTCNKKCFTKFTAQERQDIHDRYIALDYESQGLFIKLSIDEKPIMRRSKVEAAYKRNTTYIYHLKSFNNTKTAVCKCFFLSTLGYKPNNDRRIVTAMKKAIDEQKTLRGTYQRTLIDRQALKDHIMSYNPAVSHYRREHAPNKLYLPSDITITTMHENFCLVHPEIEVSLEVYRKVVREEMNISFAHLGNEECEQCEYFKRHNSLHTQQPDDSCEICQNFTKHHKPRYTDSRKEYEEDKSKVENVKDTVFYSVDLQKVIMLPRIEQFKSAIFCPRLIAFNESFVPLGPVKGDNLPYAVLWNESISGRSQDDIISAFKAFLDHKRDVKHIVFWLDNCSAQNKNWALLSFLVNIINSGDILADSITLKYFEPGHTFMSADSFHHQVEQSLQRKGKVYDFNDFVDSVQKCNKRKNIVKVMEVSDFISYEDMSSQHKLRKQEPRVYLNNIMAVRVERGLYKLKYKLSHSQEYKPEALDFLQVKITKTERFPAMQKKINPRGITQERKSAIIGKLLPLMPENRKAFWLNLPTSESSLNLLEEN